VESTEAVVGHLGGRLARGDLVLTLGAGDIWKVGEELLKVLESA